MLVVLTQLQYGCGPRINEVWLYPIRNTDYFVKEPPDGIGEKTICMSEFYYNQVLEAKDVGGR